MSQGSITIKGEPHDLHKGRSPERRVVALTHSLAVLDCGHVRDRAKVIPKPMPARGPIVCLCDACRADCNWILKDYGTHRGFGLPDNFDPPGDLHQ